MMSKWDTIQADVQDQYTHLEEEEAYSRMIEDEEDVFGFAKAISIDHLSDEQLDMISTMFETREAE
jgi:hypothetical protein